MGKSQDRLIMTRPNLGFVWGRTGERGAEKQGGMGEAANSQTFPCVLSPMLGIVGWVCGLIGVAAASAVSFYVFDFIIYFSFFPQKYQLLPIFFHTTKKAKHAVEFA
jgi:hypothetical protein